MTVDLDVSRAPLGQIAAARLVSAVAASDDRVERYFLEVKSDLDLTKKTDVAKIAKYILGSANRLPDVAATAFEGYGVMVVGVAPGDARGVPPIEVLEIDKIVSRYLGAAGPRWDLIRVPVPDSGKEVLVIVVDPPKDGQQPFPCRKDGDGLIDGRIYIRADGETREAKGDEFDRLLKRGAIQEVPEVAFEVTIDGVAHPVAVDVNRTLDDYVGQTTRRLADALPHPEPGLEAGRAEVPPLLARSLMPQINAVARMQSSMFPAEPEKRTEAEYEASITEWENDFRQCWQGAVDRLAGRSLGPISLRVKNEAKTFLHDVEVKIRLQGAVQGVEWTDGDEFDPAELGLPDSPRSWGPVQRSTFADILGTPYPSGVTVPSTYHSSLEWHNSGSVDICLDVGDLRPLEEYVFDDEEIILVVPSEVDAETVNGTWEITARGHNEIYTGAIAVEVADPVDLTSAMRMLLGLDPSDRTDEGGRKG